jgi:hypothetical protein
MTVNLEAPLIAGFFIMDSTGLFIAGPKVDYGPYFCQKP